MTKWRFLTAVSVDPNQNADLQNLKRIKMCFRCNVYPDQTAWMLRLIQVYTGRITLKSHFVMILHFYKLRLLYFKCLLVGQDFTENEKVFFDTLL